MGWAGESMNRGSGARRAVGRGLWEGRVGRGGVRGREIGGWFSKRTSGEAWAVGWGGLGRRRQVEVKNSRWFSTPTPLPAERHAHSGLGGCASRTNPRFREPFTRAFPRNLSIAIVLQYFRARRGVREGRWTESLAIPARTAVRVGPAQRRRSSDPRAPSSSSSRSTTPPSAPGSEDAPQPSIGRRPKRSKSRTAPPPSAAVLACRRVAR